MQFRALLLTLTVLIWSTETKVLTQTQAAQELIKGGISRSFISNYICLIQSESGFDTRKITGPKSRSNYYYGIFQIGSDKWCSRGRIGGICNKKCEDFINDDIRDDIICAKQIYMLEGFKYWGGWVKNCKNKPLPNVLV